MAQTNNPAAKLANICQTLAKYGITKTHAIVVGIFILFLIVSLGLHSLNVTNHNNQIAWEFKDLAQNPTPDIDGKTPAVEPAAPSTPAAKPSNDFNTSVTEPSQITLNSVHVVGIMGVLILPLFVGIVRIFSK